MEHESAVSGNVLITSLSQKVPLVREVRKALTRVAPSGRVLGADRDPAVVGRHFVDDFWEMPSLEDLTPGDLAGECRGRRIRWIVPTRDGELRYFARHRPGLEDHGIFVMVTGTEAVDLCLDKLRFYRVLALRRQLSPIYTATTPDRAEVDRWVVKERFGAGGRGLIPGVGSEEALRHGAVLGAPVFQPFVEGMEFSADLYISRGGRPLGCVVRSRDRIVSGESRVTTVVENRVLEERSLEVAELLGIRGHALVQWIVDAAGREHLLECNSRFGGASTLSVAAGLDSFFWFLRETLGDDLASIPRVSGRAGLRQVRYPADALFNP